MLEPWAAAIEEASGGRVKIEIYPSMSLGGSPPQLFRQVADGVVDIIWTVNGYTPGLFPRSEVFELPTVFTNDIAATNLAMRDMFDEQLAPDFEDVHVLFLHVHAGQALQMASKLVRTPDDTQGLKLRVPGPTGNAVVEAMGATPVTMPVPDLPQALSTNAVDGALIPWEIIPALQLYETTQYQIEGPNQNRFGTTTFQVSMNKARWEGLPDDLKAVFDAHCGEEWLRDGRRDLARVRRRRHRARGRERQRARRADRGGDGGLQHGARAGGRRLDRGARRRLRRGGAGGRGAGGARRPGSLERRGLRGRRRAAASRDAHRRRRGDRRGSSRWWALLGGLLTLGLAAMTAVSAALEHR